MREVIFYESSEVTDEYEILKSHPYMLEGYEEWKDDIRKNPFQMMESSYKKSRYNNHFLYSDIEGFPFVGFWSSHTHKEEKVCRVVWNILYSNEVGHKVNKLESLPEDLRELFWTKINSSISSGNSPVLVFVTRACVDYHKKPFDFSLTKLDSYLTEFENNYKKHHKGRLPDSVSFLGRLAELVERIF